MSLHACSTVTVEDIAVLGKCCLSGRDSSLNLLFLFVVSAAVSLSPVDVAFNVLDLSVVDKYWYVVFPQHLYLRIVQIQILIFSFNS